MIGFLGKYWKVLLSIILVAAAIFVYQNIYEVERLAYESERGLLNNSIDSLQTIIQNNQLYESIQEQLEDETAKLQESRLELYEHFPIEMKQEDQILYVLYLEQIFGTEINFSFSQPEPIVGLRDGSQLMGLTLDVNYETNYQGFKDMVKYLATDNKYITSVRFASIEYDSEQDVASGRVTLLLYLMDSDLLEYLPPELVEPDVGKENIYESATEDTERTETDD